MAAPSAAPPAGPRQLLFQQARAVLRRLHQVASAVLGRLSILGHGLRRCAFAALAVVLVNVMFAAVPQGRELLALSVEGGRSHAHWPHTLQVASALLSLIVWYSGRLLMRLGDLIETRQETAELFFFEAWWATWLPRLLGLLCVAPLAVYVAEAGGRAGVFATPWLIVGMVTCFTALNVLEGDVRRGFQAGAYLVLLGLALAAHGRTGTAAQLLLSAAAMVALDRLLAWLQGRDGAVSPRLSTPRRRGAWAAVLLLLGAGAFVAWAVISSNGRYPRTGPVVLALSLLSILLAAFVVYRSRFVPGLRGTGEFPSSGQREPPPPTLVTGLILGGAVLVGLALTAAACLAPLTTGRVFGTPALIYASAALWCVLGGVILTFLPRFARLPSLAWLLLIPLVYDGCFVTPILISTVAEEPMAGDQAPVRRLDVVSAYQDWARGRPADDQGPIYLVAAAGGGIRAAFLTASFLAAADDLTQGGFGDRVLVISGVSGGSLGAAVYAATRDPAARLAGADPRCLAAVTAAPLRLGPRQAAVHCTLDADFLSPTVATFLFHDLVQDFLLPWLPTQDRGRTLEQAWTAEVERIAPGAFPGRFLRFGAGSRGPGRPAGAWIPHLVLNGTSIQSGARILASSLTWPQSAAIDLFSPGYQTGALSLAGAVHNSARFPFVSPVAAYSWRPEPPPRPDGAPLQAQVADGGYFDNSGGIALVEIIRALPDEARRRARVIYVTNDGEERLVCGSPNDGGAAGLDPQLAAPLSTMLATRTARTELSKDQLNQALEAHGPCGDYFIEVSLNKHRLAGYLARTAPGPVGSPPARGPAADFREPPLGWALAAGTTEWLGAYALDAARIFEGPEAAAPALR